MAGGGLRSGRSVLKSRDESNGVTYGRGVNLSKKPKTNFSGLSFFDRKLWKSKNCDFARKCYVFEELGGEVGAFGIDFFRGIRFSRSQGLTKRVQNGS